MMDIFTMTEQPVTCSRCGARAEIIQEFKEGNLCSQLCKCPETGCQYLFIEQEDEFVETRNQHEH
jgi:hypothetical protein